MPKRSTIFDDITEADWKTSRQSSVFDELNPEDWQEAPEFSVGRTASQVARAGAQGLSDLVRGARGLESMAGYRPSTPGTLGGELANIRSRARQYAAQDPFTEVRNLAVSELKPIEEYAPEMLPGVPKGFGGMVEQAAAGMARFAPSMATSAVSAPAGLVSTFTQIFGMERDKYLKQGIDEDRANVSAMVSALGQTPIEFAGNLLQIGALKNIAKGITRPAARRLANFGQALAKGFIGEGGEEYFQKYPEVIADVYASNPDKKPTELAKIAIDKIKTAEFQKEAGYEALIGAIGGLGLAGAGGIVSEATRPFVGEGETAKPSLTKDQILNGLENETITVEKAERIKTERPEMAETVDEAIKDYQEKQKASEIEKRKREFVEPTKLTRERNQEIIDAVDLDLLAEAEQSVERQQAEKEEAGISEEAAVADRTTAKRRFDALSKIWDTLSDQEQEKAIDLILPRQEAPGVAQERQQKAEAQTFDRTKAVQKQAKRSADAEIILKGLERRGIELNTEERAKLEREAGIQEPEKQELQKVGQWVEPTMEAEDAGGTRAGIERGGEQISQTAQTQEKERPVAEGGKERLRVRDHEKPGMETEAGTQTRKPGVGLEIPQFKDIEASKGEHPSQMDTRTAEETLNPKQPKQLKINKVTDELSLFLKNRGGSIGKLDAGAKMEWLQEFGIASHDTGRKLRYTYELSDGRVVSADGALKYTNPEAYKRLKEKYKSFASDRAKADVFNALPKDVQQQMVDDIQLDQIEVVRGDYYGALKKHLKENGHILGGNSLGYVDELISKNLIGALHDLDMAEKSTSKTAPESARKWRLNNKNAPPSMEILNLEKDGKYVTVIKGSKKNKTLEKYGWSQTQMFESILGGLADTLKNETGSSQLLTDVINVFAKKQTDSPEFKKWFNDSKVVDDNGRPLVVYHGSGRQGIDIFDPERTGEILTGDWGKGVYFTPAKFMADEYRRGATKSIDEKVNKLWSEYQSKAKELGTDPMSASIDLGFGSEKYNELQKYEERWRDRLREIEKENGGDVYPVYLSIKNPKIYTYSGITDPFLAERAKANGHDGIIIVSEDGYTEEIIAFEPNQIKSATENNGLFDPNNPSIKGSSELINDIAYHGAKLIREGIDTYEKFKVRMFQKFRKVWDKIKDHIRDLWNILSNQRGSINLESRQYKDLKSFQEKTKSDLGLKQFDLFFRNNGDIELSLLVVDKGKRRQGVGSEVMKRLVEYADQNGKRVFLNPAIKDDYHGTTSRARLIRFYKRFGFIENKGRNKDFTLPPGMFRDPKISKGPIGILKNQRGELKLERQESVDDLISMLQRNEPKKSGKESKSKIKITQTPIGPVQYSDTISPVTQQDYMDNRNQRRDIKLQATSGFRRVRREIAEGADKYLGAISTRLGNISPKLKSKLRKLDFDINTSMAEDIKKVQPLLKKAKRKMTDADFADWDYARKNSDINKINELIQKYDLQNEYDAYREVLDRLREDALDVGLAIGVIDEYAPRVLKDSGGFLTAIGKEEEWPIYSRRLKERANEMGVSVSEMTDDEKANIISNMILFGQTGLGGLRATKQRKIQKIPPSLNRFYMDSDAALVDHIYRMRKGIEARRFFGKIPKKVSDIRRQLNITRTKLKEINDKLKSDPENDALQKKRNEYFGQAQEYWAYLEKYALQRDYTENIGQYVLELIESRQIGAKDERAVNEILHARFHEKGTYGLINAYKNMSYIDTMGSPISALTQIGDLAWAAYDAGIVKTIRYAAQAFKGKSKITKEDVGVERIAQEFADASTLSKAVSAVFRATGLEKIDSIGKETLLNAAYEKYKAQAKKNPAKLKSEIEDIFEDETDSVIDDLLNDKITDNVKLLVYNRLLDFQPVALSEMPEKYLTAGNGRIFYMLKTFTIKQFDAFRNEAYNKIKNGTRQEKIQGMRNLVRLAMFFVLANAGADELKDFVLGRKTEWQDRLIDNALRLFGVSKFITWQARTEGVGSALAKQILPPFKFIDSVTRDIITAGDEKGLETVGSIPLVGKLYYWHMGRGTGKRTDLWELRFRRVKRKLQKINTQYEESSDRSAFRKKHRKDLRFFERMKQYQGSLNSLQRKINRMKKSKDPNTELIERHVERRIERMKQFLEQYKGIKEGD